MHPLLIAHRGDPVHAPENTLASFRSAIAKGAKAVETDVRRSSDGVWVAFHDLTLRRTTGRRGILARTPWTALRPLGIPRITQVLDLCRRRHVRVVLDVKVTQGEGELFKVLKQSGWLHQTVVGAGTKASLKRWRRLLGKRPLFWVTGFRARVTRSRVGQARRLKLTGLLVYRGWITKGSLRRVHEAGLRCYVWTVRTPTQLKRFSALGVDGVMCELWPPPSI
ncbi:MAG: glycerophosphodiester phosphodiesterase [Candidatus Omnitrophica bacterium]|nr:glycerophosphodiester phosphodiesterase [Candidatus Omnitrophota bacterium]